MEDFIMNPQVVDDNVAMYMLSENILNSFSCIKNGKLYFGNKFNYDLLEKITLTIGTCIIERTKEECDFLIEMDPKANIDEGVLDLYFWFSTNFYIGELSENNIGKSFKLDVRMKSFNVFPKFLITACNPENIYDKGIIKTTIFKQINNNEEVPFNHSEYNMQEIHWKFNNPIDDSEAEFSFLGVLESETENTFLTRKVNYFNNLVKIAYDIETPDYFYFYRLPIIKYMDHPEMKYVSFKITCKHIDDEWKHYTAIIVARMSIFT